MSTSSTARRGAAASSSEKSRTTGSATDTALCCASPSAPVATTAPATTPRGNAWLQAVDVKDGSRAALIPEWKSRADVACEIFKGPDGTTFIMCGRTRAKRPRCSSCGKAADFLCDYQLQGSRLGKTCDRPLCGQCRRQQPGGKDYCRVHSDMAEREKSSRDQPGGAVQVSLPLFGKGSLSCIAGGKRG